MGGRKIKMIITDKTLIKKIVELVGVPNATNINVSVVDNRITIHTFDLAARINEMENYILTLDPNTPHYRDTKKYINRLREKAKLVL